LIFENTISIGFRSGLYGGRYTTVKKSALIAVAHKLLVIANAMVTAKTTWRHPIVAEIS
jgi:hypothetical protein